MKPNLYNLPTRHPSYATFIDSFVDKKSPLLPAILLLLAGVLLLGIGCSSGNDNTPVTSSEIIELPPPGITESSPMPATASSTKPYNSTNAGYTDDAEEEEEKQPTRKQPRREEPTAHTQETQPERKPTYTYTTSTPTNVNTYTDEPRTPTTPPPSPTGFNTPATGSSGNPSLTSTPPPTTTSVVMPPVNKPTPPPPPEKIKTPEPAGVFVSLNEKNQLKKELESAFESAEGKKFDSFSLKNRFADPMVGNCITGSFLDKYDNSFSLYTYFGRMRQESYDIVVEDLTFNDEGKIVQVKVRERAKLNKAEN